MRCGAAHKNGRPCGEPAEPGKNRCRIHGGASTGPKTQQGQARALANLKQNRPRDSVAGTATQHPPQVVDPATPSAPPASPVTATSTDKGTQAMTSNTDNDTAAHVELRLAALENEHDAALAALDEAQAAFGDAVLAGDPDTTTQAAESVKARKGDIERLQAAREAMQRRLVAARDREAHEAWTARWDAFAEALEHRHAVFEKAEKLAAPFFAAVSEAVDAAAAAEALAPIQERVLTTTGWAVMPDFFRSMADMHKGDMPPVKQALRDMAARSRAYGEQAMSLREYDRPGEARVTDFEDPRAKVKAFEEPLVVQAQCVARDKSLGDRERYANTPASEIDASKLTAPVLSRDGWIMPRAQKGN